MSTTKRDWHMWQSTDGAWVVQVLLPRPENIPENDWGRQDSDWRTAGVFGSKAEASKAVIALDAAVERAAGK